MRHHTTIQSHLFLLSLLTITLLPLTSSALPIPFPHLTTTTDLELQLPLPSSLHQSISIVVDTPIKDTIPTPIPLSLSLDLLALPTANADQPPSSDPMSAIPLSSLRSPGKRRPGRPGGGVHAQVHGNGYGRIRVWNPWTWRSELRRGKGCRWRSRKMHVGDAGRVAEVVEEVKGKETDVPGVATLEDEKGKVVETVQEQVVDKEEVEEVQQDVQQPIAVAASDNSKSAAPGTTPNISPLSPLNEELPTSSASITQPIKDQAAQTTTEISKALIDLIVPAPSQSHTQLDQNGFSGGLGGGLVPFERVPMVEFVKFKE